MHLERILLERLSEEENSDQHAYKAFKEQDAYELGQLLSKDPKWQEAFIRFGTSTILKSGLERSKSFLFSMLEHYKGDSTYFFEGSSVRELIRFVVSGGYLADVLHKLVVNPFASKHFLEIIKNLEQQIWPYITPDNIFDETFNNINIEEVEFIKELSSNVTQHIDLRDFLESYKDYLENVEYFICLRLLVLCEVRLLSQDCREQFFLTFMDFLPNNNVKKFSKLYDYFVFNTNPKSFLVNTFKNDPSLVEKVITKNCKEDDSIDLEKLSRLKSELQRFINVEDQK